MPAYRERVYICPAENGQPAWIVDFPVWWKRGEFFQEYGARQIDTGHPFQVNHALLLTAWEASAWDRQCQTQLAQDPHGGTSFVKDAMRQLEAKLRDAQWVVVESYEWES